MEFLKKRPNDRKYPVVLKNWMHTLEGFLVSNKYLREIQFASFITKNFNQDPIENFFGQVRQHGGRNVNPNCNSFLGYYKSLIINSYTQTSLKLTKL